MNTWAEDVLATMDAARCEQDVLERLAGAAAALGFEHCAYARRRPLPLASPKTLLLNNYPAGWQRRYVEAGYLDIDPTVQHCRQSQAPVIWSDEVFADVPQLWDEARSFGLRVGWAQSSLDASGASGMLTLCRADTPLTPRELLAKELRMRWLASITHLTVTRILALQGAADSDSRLSLREIEVLKWTADGKTSSEVAQILVISVDTVNFHVKNAMAKLRTANKTSTVVRAAMLGMLS